MLRRRIFIGDSFGVGPLYNTYEKESVEQQRRIVAKASEVTGASIDQTNEVYEYGCLDPVKNDCRECSRNIIKVCQSIGSMIVEEGENPENYGFSVVPEKLTPHLYIYEGLEELIHTSRRRQHEQDATIGTDE